MTMIVLGSAKGSPGVTTATIALAATWPGEEPVLVAEMDRAGGDIAARFGLASEPGLTSLAAATRHDAPGRELVWQHTQELPGGLPVLIAPPSSKRTRAALTMLKLSALQAIDGVVLCDVGRVDIINDPAAGVIGAADLLLIVTRPTVPDVHHLAAALFDLCDANDKVAIILSGRGTYSRDDVEHALGIEVVGSLPHDPHGADAVCGVPTSVRTFGRLALIRGGRTIAATLSERLQRANQPEQAAAEEAIA